jgi:hypothetical protein
MRRSIPRDVPLVHCVAAVEMHAIGRSRAIEMCPARLRIFSGIDVRSHDVAVIIDVIAKLTSDVVPVFGNSRAA